MKKISLNIQINELNRELKQREDVYPRLVAGAKMRQSIADFQMEALKAAIMTLKFCQKYEAKIRAAAKAIAKDESEAT